LNAFIEYRIASAMSTSYDLLLQKYIIFIFETKYLIKRNDFTHIFVNLLYKVHKIGLLLSVILLLFDCHVKIYERRGVAN